MNLKIENNALRFRITATDLEELLAGRALEECVEIGPENLIIGIIPTGGVDRLLAKLSGNRINLVVSPARINELADLGRSREGLNDISGGTEISLQVDFRTQKRQDARSSHQAS